MTAEPSDGGPCENTDRHLWPDVSKYDAPHESIHVTKEGGIGINVGGTVYVKSLREWHRLAGGPIGIRPSKDEVAEGWTGVHPTVTEALRFSDRGLPAASNSIAYGRALRTLAAEVRRLATPETGDVPKLKTDLELSQAAVNRISTGHVRDTLRLLASNEISAARAHEWLIDFVRDGKREPLPETTSETNAPLEYTHEMGEAADRYLQSKVPQFHVHHLPATFRWHELWDLWESMRTQPAPARREWPSHTQRLKELAGEPYACSCGWTNGSHAIDCDALPVGTPKAGEPLDLRVMDPSVLTDEGRARLKGDILPGAVTPILMGGGFQPGVGFAAMTHNCTKHGLISGPECERCGAEVNGS